MAREGPGWVQSGPRWPTTMHSVDSTLTLTLTLTLERKAVFWPSESSPWDPLRTLKMSISEAVEVCGSVDKAYNVMAYQQ